MTEQHVGKHRTATSTDRTLPTTVHATSVVAGPHLLDGITVALFDQATNNPAVVHFCSVTIPILQAAIDAAQQVESERIINALAPEATAKWMTAWNKPAASIQARGGVL